MPGDPSVIVSTWRTELPTLAGRSVTLREPVFQDAGALVELLSLRDATRFGIDEPMSDLVVQDLIDRAARERASGLALTYVITLTASRTVAGLIQVRQLDPAFEPAEWQCTIPPSARGTGIFLQAAPLAGTGT